MNRNVPLHIARWIIMVCLLLIFQSCKKDSDSERPSIVVTTPQGETILNIPDSVLLIADVYDNHNIESIKVVLVNSDRVNIDDPTIYFPGTTHYRVEQFVKVEDKLLASGDYYILVFALDGVNSKSEYIPVQINEVPRDLEGFVMVERAGVFNHRINYLSPDFEPDTAIEISSGFSLSAINNPSEQFYYVTPQPSQLLAFPLRKPDADWLLQAVPPYPEFTAMFVDSELILASANGDVFVYDDYGGVVMNTVIEKDRQVEVLTANTDYIVCEMRSLNGADFYLYVFYRGTGGINKNIKLSARVSGLAPLDSDFIITENAGVNTDIYLLEPEEGVLTRVRSIEEAHITGVLTVDDQKTLLNTGHEILSFDVHYNQLSLYSDVDAHGFFYEPLNQVVCYFNEQGYGVLDYPSGQELTFVNCQEEILDFHPVYNK